MQSLQQSIGLSGQVIISVLNPDGSTDRTYPPIKNLWVDQGLNALERMTIPEAFEVCGKGTSQDVVKEVVHVSNTYTLAGSTITRNASPATPRDFTPNDVGKLIRVTTTPFGEMMISAFTDSRHVDVMPVGALALPAVFTNKAIYIFGVNLTGLSNEAHLRDSFETITKVDGSDTVTATGAVFSSTDVGKALFVRKSVLEPITMRYAIVARISTTQVTVDRTTGAFSDRDFRVYTPQTGNSALTPLSRTSQTSTVTGENSTTDIRVSGKLTGERDLKRTFIFQPEPESLEYLPSGDTTINWAGTAVTKTAGTRSFIAGDVKKYIKTTNGQYAQITVFNSASSVTVDRAPDASITNSHFTLYGNNSYDGILFSDSDEPENNANVIIRLENGSGVVTPVFLAGANPELPGQQLKVTYICKAYVGPNVVSAIITAPITDPNSLLSGSKTGRSAVEGLALASIDSAGNTQTSFAILEPSIPGYVALSPSFTPSVALALAERSAGVVSKPMTAKGYTPGNFTQLYEGIFEINEANATNWRTLGIYDVDTGVFAFVFVFGSNQHKTGEIILVVRFRKSWNRDLSA